MGDLDPHHYSASQTRGSGRKGNNGHLEIGLSFPFSLAQKRAAERLMFQRLAHATNDKGYLPASPLQALVRRRQMGKTLL